MFTSLTSDNGAAALASSEVGVSSLMDTWLLLANVAVNGERTRTLQVLKSRGMPHSNQVREFVFSDHGVDLVDVYLFGDQVLTGTARIAHEAQLSAANDLRGRDHDRRLRDLANRRKALDAQIAAIRLEADERAGEVEFAIAREKFEAESSSSRAREIAAARGKTQAITGRRKA
jgi:circadian clock protein KaiC